VTGDRAWALRAADGSYPAAGFHTRGEMGGFWLLDLRIGAVLPDGATVTSATLNGSPVELKLVRTTRGLEAVISAQPEQRTATLVINIAD
jgi:hypothetical protein